MRLLPLRILKRLGCSLSNLAIVALCLLSAAANGHGGGLNSYSCHNQSATSEYHCHGGDYDGLTFKSEALFLEYIRSEEGAQDPDAGQPNEIPPYRREDYLPQWADTDGDCVNTRHEVLILESLVPVTMTQSGCAVATGEWFDPATGEIFTFASDVDVDHHVALSEAHESGAYAWTTTEKRAYANDLLNATSLVAMDDSTNSSKGDKDPAQWLPPNSNYHCSYVKHWVETKTRYGLSYDEAERGAVEAILGKPLSQGARSATSGIQASTGAEMARFSLGILQLDECGYSDQGVVDQPTRIDFEITPDLLHLESELDILVIAQLDNELYSVSGDLTLTPFDAHTSNLTAFAVKQVFNQSRVFTLIESKFGAPVIAQFYLGYRTADGDIVYSKRAFPVLFAAKL